MTGQPQSRRGVLTKLCTEMRQQECTYREIAARIRREQRVNVQVAFRL